MFNFTGFLSGVVRLFNLPCPPPNSCSLLLKTTRNALPVRVFLPASALLVIAVATGWYFSPSGVAADGRPPDRRRRKGVP